MNEYELEEIKREIVESRSLSIKSNNLVNALAADIKSIAKRQQGQERRAVFNSATAYVVTIAVVLLFVKLAWDLQLDVVPLAVGEADGLDVSVAAERPRQAHGGVLSAREQNQCGTAAHPPPPTTRPEPQLYRRVIGRFAERARPR